MTAEEGAGTLAVAPGHPALDPLPSVLFPRLASGVRWGLERTTAVLRGLGDPHLAYPTLHVAGTNGKGSVAASWASVLGESGLRVGLYTSPHLCRYAERILVGGRPASDATLLEAARDVRAQMERVGLTFFEATTVLAFHVFAGEGVDVGVIEVGLGGRLDSTNVVSPLVSAITNVALDHADYLGETLREIAGEKAGIIKPGVPVITAEAQPDLRDVIRDRANVLGASFHIVEASDVQGLELRPERTSFVLSTEAWGSLELSTPLAGAHQALNAALAVKSLERLPPELLPDRESLFRGLAELRWPGRLQFERLGGEIWIFDVAHNTAGTHSMVEALRRIAPGGPRVAVVGILGDKDWSAMLPPLLSVVDAAVFTETPSAFPERRWDPETAALAVEAETPIEIQRDFREALERARARAAGGTVIVTGSHHTVGDAMILLGIEPFVGPFTGFSPRPS